MTGHLLRAALGVCTALAFGAPAFASGVDVYGGAGRFTANVKITNSDLHTLAGAKTLALRLRVAAAEVCGGDDPVLRASSGFARCQEASIDRATATLDSPLLADALGRAPRSLARAGR